MAHKTLIGGTAYEIKGGKTLIDGTAFSIKSGKTLVDGTAYEVGFAKPATITLSFTKTGGRTVGEVTSVVIKGVDYSQSKYAEDLSTTEITVPKGTGITCKILIAPTSLTTILLNNKNVVLTGVGEYLYTVVGDATIAVSSLMNFTPQTGTQPYGYIKINEL